MSNPIPDVMSFARAAALQENQLLIAAVPDECLKNDTVDTVLMWFDGGQLVNVGWVNDHVRSIKPSGAGFVVLTEDGLLLNVVNGEVESEVNLLDGPVNRPLGPFRDCYSDGDKTLAGGFNQAALLVEGGKIEDFSRGLTDDRTMGFNALDGYGLDEVYGVDPEGAIWRHDSQTWHECGSPAKSILTGVCCASSGDVYAVGLNGTVVKGRHDTWQLLDLGLPYVNFYSVAEWKGRIYLAGLQGVLTMAPDGSDVDFGSVAEGSSSNYVISGGKTLWSVGPKDILWRQDDHWTPFFH